MKRIHLIAVAVCVLAGAGAGFAYQELRAPPSSAVVQTGDYSAYLPEDGRKVVFYSLSTCQFCNLTRALLEENAVAYDERKLDADEAFLEQAHALNARSVPLLLVGGHKIEGYDEARILAVLEQERFLER
ncbi:glutaredoxin family protein [Luteimonas sp. R10]|uniref:glutaredoxin family protein n=1 Tax=Luteimonas sp. R10 TaxID=3108176 RepID=UPI003088E067|nr:glutaredoxin family protein [Luteimonas sp. R10]